MSILSAFFAIPSIYLLLLGVVFVLLLIEIIYLFHKRSHRRVQSQPIALNSPSIVTMNQGNGHKFPIKITLTALVLVIIAGVGALAYYLTKQRSQNLQSNAHVFNKIDKCGIEIGGTVSDEPSGLGKDPSKNSKTYKVTYTIENKRNDQRGVRLDNAWFACTFNDQPTCPHGEFKANAKWDKNSNDVMLGPNQVKTRTVTATQPEGACGMFQIDVNLVAVYKGGVWDETCNNNDSRPGIGGLYWNSAACGQSPTNTPTLSPTPSPTLPGPSNTPTATPVTPPTATTTVTAPMCSAVNFYTDTTFANPLTVNDLKNLTAGAHVTVTVLGSAGTVAAQYSVNNGAWFALSLKRTGTNEFYSNTPYTIPVGITTFTVVGQIQDSSGAWH